MITGLLAEVVTFWYTWDVIMTKGTLVPCWARTMLTEMHNVTKSHYLNSSSTFKQQRSPKHHLT